MRLAGKIYITGVHWLSFGKCIDQPTADLGLQIVKKDSSTKTKNKKITKIK
jgi:hypothetical protein